MDSSRLQAIGHREFLAFEYALINPMQLESDQWRDLPAEPLRPRDFRASASMLPHLVALNALNRDARIALLTRAENWLRRRRRPLFSALLSSPQTPEVVAAHFSARMTVITPERQKFWLRFHDPRVFARLDGLLSAAQLRWLFGPIDVWTWFDGWNGQWWSRHKPEPPAQYTPTMLRAEQWSALHRLSLLNRCLKRLSRDGQLPKDYRALAERLDGLLDEALSRGLKDHDDVCLYALNVEFHGPQWPDLPHIREALQLAQQGEQSLVRSLADDDATSPRPAPHAITSSSRTVR